MQDGEVYVRRDGETTKANGDEKRALWARGERRRAKTDLRVTITGSVYRFTCAPDALDAYVNQKSQQLRTAYRPRDPMERALAGLAASGRPEPRTHEQYLSEIDEWVIEARDSLPGLVERIAASIATPLAINMHNRAETYLEEVRVRIHLPGAVKGLRPVADERVSDIAESVPSPPRRWGPLAPLWMTTAVAAPILPRNFGMPARGPSYGAVSFKNDGSVTLEFDLRELRPLDNRSSDDDDVVLVVSADEPIDTEIRGEWQATAKGHHAVYAGEVSVRVAEPTDVTPAVERVARALLEKK